MMRVPSGSPRNYNQLVDLSALESTKSGKVIGMTHKFSTNSSVKTSLQRNLHIGKLFPSYGIHDEGQTYQTTRKLFDASTNPLAGAELLMEKVQISNKPFNKKKFDLKDYMEDMLKAGIRPGVRQVGASVI